MTAERTSIRGVVETVFYSGPAFSAGRLRTANGAIVKFAGKVFLRENDAVRLEGHWVDHPKYGRQFEAEFMGHDLEMDPDGLANFLANHPDVKGIGPVKARLIADAFGRGFDAAIRASPQAVAVAAKVPVEIALDLQRIWLANSDFNTAMAYLSAFGLTHHQVTTLVGKFGSQVVPILERDPYVLVREISGFGFKRVDKIARKMGTPKDLPSRIRAGLHFCVLDALDDGDCWVEYEDLLDRANTLLVMDTIDSREVIEGHLEALISEGRLVSQPFERLVVADPEIHRMEAELAEVLKTAGGRSPHAVAEVDQLLDAEGGELNPEQRDAVGNALRFSISLVTGGAGSGKTYAVSTIASIAERLELKVVLAAPTGKAAKRLEEVVGHEASTIHRLLGFNGNTYSRDALNPIEADILVVDEVSMMDVALAWRLFHAVDRARTAVVLVGDHNQLPPVGPGNLLRDLVRSQAIPTTVLTRIIRQAGVLKENSTAILNGEVCPTSDALVGARRPWYVIDKFTDREDVRRMLLLLFEEVLKERLGYDLIRDVHVLTPTHKGPLGTVELNIELQRVLQQKLFGVEVRTVEAGHRARPHPGDKVIQTKNDYELGVMNGAMGIVVNAGADGSLVIERLIFGPKQVTARINQDPEISRQITLWSQHGSQVILGTLMVIPIKESLIYVQPLYLRAVTGKIPELRRVIVVAENRIAMEPTLDASLARVFGNAPPSGAAPPGQILTGIPATDDKQATVGTQLNAQAKMHYDRMLQAQRDGDWARFGEELKQLGSVIERLSDKK